jgi:peptidoglycan hydrolase CwlO-like protein
MEEGSKKAVVTPERKEQMSVKMKEFWNHQRGLEDTLKQRNKEIKKLKSEIKKLKLKISQQKYVR